MYLSRDIMRGEGGRGVDGLGPSGFRCFHVPLSGLSPPGFPVLSTSPVIPPFPVFRVIPTRKKGSGGISVICLPEKKRGVEV